MTTITRITTQKKRKSRYNIFLGDGQDDEKYGFSVDESLLIEHSLRKGLELDESTIATLIQKDTLHKSYTQAIHFLSYRMRTKKEIYDYLVKKEVDEEHVKQIMDRLQAEGLIDDQEFAASFVRTRIQTSSKGPMLVKRELIEKGVSASIADEAIEQYTFDVQHTKAQKLVKKSMQQRSSHSFRHQLQQLQGNLMKKGFSQDVIKDVLADIKENKDDDAEWDALVHHGEKLLRKHQAKLSGHKLRNKLKESLFRKGFAIDIINMFMDEYIVEEEQF